MLSACFTLLFESYFARKTSAMIPATIGAAADVPVWKIVQALFVVEVTYWIEKKILRPRVTIIAYKIGWFVPR